MPLLVHFFLDRLVSEVGREIGITDEAVAALEAWKWPGNVRELENVIRRAAVFAQGAIVPADLGPPIVAG